LKKGSSPLHMLPWKRTCPLRRSWRWLDFPGRKSCLCRI